MTHLKMECTSVRDISPLGGMPLTYLSLQPWRVTRGWDVLRKMKTLATILVGPDQDHNYTKCARNEFWKRYDAGEFRSGKSKSKARPRPLRQAMGHPSHRRPR